MSLINNQFQIYIKEYFKNQNINIVQNRSDIFLKQNIQIKQQLQKFLLLHNQWQTIKHIIYGIVFDIQLPVCQHCNKIIPFSKRKAKYCSRTCCNSDEKFLQNKKKIVFQKYGYENVQQVPAIKQKTKKTIKEIKENDPNYYNKILQKRLVTIKQKYQTMQNYNKQALQKRKETTLKQFGCQHIFQRNDVKQKIKIEHINNYGSLENFYKHCNKYNYFLHQGWVKIINQWKDYIIPLFNEQQYKGRTKN